jgi:LysM repeat protein
VSAHAWSAPGAPSPAAAKPGSAAGAATPTTAVRSQAVNTASVRIAQDGPRNWWDLAQQHLGAGDRWPVLWALNHGATQNDGTVLSSPNTVLRVGWQITVPAAPASTTIPHATPHTTPTTPAATAAAAARMVTVAPGDSLAQIATDHGVSWTSMWQVNQNRPQVGGGFFSDPDYLQPGWTLIVPPAATPVPAGAVTVVAGDSLSQIAVDHGSTTAAVWQANQDRPEPGGSHFADPNYLEPGWVIQIPAPPAPAQQQAAAQHAAQQQAAQQHAAAQHAAEQQAVQQHAAQQQAAAQHAAQQQAAAQHAAQQRAAQQLAAADRPSGQPAPDGHTGAGEAKAASSAGELAGPSDSSDVSMLAAAGGAVLLTALGLAALLRARRRQFRMRRPGRSMAGTPAGVAGMERLLMTAGTRGLADVTWLDQALRSLVQGLSKMPDAHLPDVVAVRLGAQELELVLASPLAAAPAPWSADRSGLRWLLASGDELPYDEAERELHIPPYPLLVSVGYTPAGDHYLIDLERIGSMSLSGDRERCLNLARFIAAEIAHNQWSELLEVTLVGFGQEMAQMNPEQLKYAPDLGRVLEAVQARLAGVDEVMTATGVDVATGRLRCVAGDTWAPHVLLIAPDAAQGPDLAELLTVLNGSKDRLTVAVVLAAAPAAPEVTRWHLQVDAAGVLSVPALELELVAEQLPSCEAAQMAQLLAAAAVEQDEPMPPAQGDQAWQSFTDVAGNLRPQVSTTGSEPALRVAGTWPARPNSILPLPAGQYAATAATTEQDVAMLAPGVSEQVQAQLAGADPTLDADLAAWWDPVSTQVKLRLLGPLQVWAAGLDPAPPGLPQKVEAIAYLATRNTGASAAQCRADLWPADQSDKPTSKVRNLLHSTRSWLGVNPQTGREYVPSNPGEGRGGQYLIQGLVIDAELFRRLRLRALARGAAGLDDLRAALDLVTGLPFEQRRPGGYGWVANTGLDYTYIGMIADVAHLLATHHLAAGEPEPAAAAAQVALMAGSAADEVLLDLVAACHAQGDEDGGDGYVSKIMRNHAADTEEDIPTRTYEILLRHHWLPKPRSA